MWRFDMSDNFSTAFSNDDLYILISLGKKYGFDPLSSIECEEYLLELLQKYDERLGDKYSYIENAISKSFISYEHKPNWVQTADWQFDMAKPMLFVGQKEITMVNGQITFNYTFYIFWNTTTGKVKTVIQSD